MAHPKQRFSDKQVRGKLKAGMHADGQGLYLAVDESGARRWILRVTQHGKRREMGLGGFPGVGLAEARETAARFRKIVKVGGDPFVVRDKNRQTIPTFAEAAETVHKERSPSWKNPKHAQQWINTLQQFAFSTFGDTPINDIHSDAVHRAILPIWLDKPETARRVLQRIGTVMDWARAKRFRTDNPTDGIRAGLPKQTDRAKHHEALPYSEVPAFVRQLQAAGASDAVKQALEFLILTATRTGEVIGATWSEIDLKNKVWTIPAERMKAGVEHKVPLTDRCVEILEAAKVGCESLFIFQIDKKPLSNMAMLMALRRMGLTATAHGFRSSFRDWTADKTNYPREVCEAALAHTVGNAVEAAYRRTDLFEKRRSLMATWSQHVTSAKGKLVAIAA